MTPSLTSYSALIGALFDALKESAVVLPAALIAPTGGGPVTGTAVIT